MDISTEINEVPAICALNRLDIALLSLRVEI